MIGLRLQLDLLDGRTVRGTVQSVNDRAVFLTAPCAAILLRHIMGARILRTGVSPARIPWGRFVRQKLAASDPQKLAESDPQKLAESDPQKLAEPDSGAR